MLVYQIGDPLDIALDSSMIARLQFTDMEHHVDLVRSQAQCFGGFELLHPGETRSEREAGYRRELNLVAAQLRCGKFEVRAVDHHLAETEFHRFVAQENDLVRSTVRTKIGMVDHRGYDLPGGNGSSRNVG